MRGLRVFTIEHPRRPFKRILARSRHILIVGVGASTGRLRIAGQSLMTHKAGPPEIPPPPSRGVTVAAPVPRGAADGDNNRTQVGALVASEMRYRRLFESARDGILILDADTGVVVDVNPFLVELLGFSRETFLGKTLWELGFFGDIVANLDSFAELKREKYVRYDDKPLRAKDGRRIDVEFVSNVYGVNGQAVIQCNVRDITDRKRSAEALRAHQLLLTESQRLGHIGSWFWEMTGPFQWSEEAYRIYGVSPDTFIPTPEALVNLIHPDDRPGMESWLRACATGDEHELEYRIIWPDGTVRTLMGRGEAVGSIGNRPAYMAGTVQDVTLRMRAEAERVKLEAQLRQAHKMESVGRLAGGVAHDFNNMLLVILGYTELALEGLDPTRPLHGDLLAIRTAAKRSADLTSQLLAFARKQTIVPRVLDLNAIVEPMLTMLRRLIGEDLELVWRPANNAWPVEMDPTQIDQVLANLCVNARDAISGVGRVTIATANAALDDAYCAAHPGFTPGDYLRLTVTDDGCGMDEETRAHLFEPFFTTKAAGKGTGLGLATVYGIVKQNQGFIDVDSEPGIGTTFRIYLPRHSDPGGPARILEAVGQLSRGHETILVVEDDPAVLKLTVRMLSELGYTVVAAQSPGEAIRLAGECAADIHIMITDVIMPGMNGPDLATALVALSPQLKCLFVSGYTADVITHRGVLTEGVHFLQKPFAIGDLAAKVRKVLDGN
jgi:two-component system, cell cycle sensor histidine kinase and response regulator CckA